jgi:hypothetical protein
MNQSKLIVFIIRIDLVSSRFSQYSSQVSDDTTSIVCMHTYFADYTNPRLLDDDISNGPYFC